MDKDNIIEKQIITSIGLFRQPTPYEGVYMYVAPEGYNFWSYGTCYGSVIWGGKELDNYYYFKKIEEDENNTDENSE